MLMMTSALPVHSASIAGTKCSKLNASKVISNKKFTCIKSGKNLIWNKGITVKSSAKSASKANSAPSPIPVKSAEPSPSPTQSAQPTPTVTPSPTPSKPTKIPVTRREKALAEVRRVYEANSGKNPGASVKYIIAPDAPTVFAQMMKEVIPVSAQFWANVFTPSDNFPIILGNSSNVTWVQNEMKKFGHNLTSWDLDTIKSQGLNSSRGDVRSNERSTITQYVIGDRASEGIPNNIYLMRSFVSHEYVHAVAVSILGDRHEGIPGWSVEGSANFFGFAITSLMSSDAESAMERVNVDNLRRPYYERGGLVPHSLNKDDLHKALVLSEKGGGGDGTTCAEPKILCYSAGALLTEILIADYGFEKFVQWWKLSRTKNWEVVFEDVYNYQIDQWYEDVAIPYVLAESRAAVPEVALASSGSAAKKHSARASRPFIEPGYKSQEALRALTDWESMISKSSKEPSITTIAGNSTDSKLIEDVKSYSNAALRYFSSFPEAIQPMSFYLTNEVDLDWFINELGKVEPGLSEQDKSNIRSRMSQWGDYSEIRGTEGKSRIELGITSSRLKNYVDSYRAQNIAGLVAQSFQNNVTGNKSNSLPCWATKGAKSFYGLTTSRQVDAVDYFVERVQLVGDWYKNRSKYNFKNFKTADWENFLPKATGSNNSLCENDSFVTPVGFLFTELMMSQFGHEKIVNWWSLTKSNSDWRANFNQAFGISVDTWQRQYAIPYLVLQMEKLIIPLWWG
jgi:hypothetical protein